MTTIPTIGFNVETVEYKNISFTVRRRRPRSTVAARGRVDGVEADADAAETDAILRQREKSLAETAWRRPRTSVGRPSTFAGARRRSHRQLATRTPPARLRDPQRPPKLRERRHVSTALGASRRRRGAEHNTSLKHRSGTSEVRTRSARSGATTTRTRRASSSSSTRTTGTAWTTRATSCTACSTRTSCGSPSY